MDKFGIFNVLSSLFEFYNKEKQKQTEGENQNAQSFSVKSEKENAEKPTKKTEETFLPLQAGMLNVSKTHDEIVKRVLERQKNSPR